MDVETVDRRFFFLSLCVLKTERIRKPERLVQFFKMANKFFQLSFYCDAWSLYKSSYLILVVVKWLTLVYV